MKVAGEGGVGAGFEEFVGAALDLLAVVSCEGNIIATYSGEDAPFPLNARQYLSVEEGGEWRMCGYR